MVVEVGAFRIAPHRFVTSCASFTVQTTAEDGLVILKLMRRAMLYRFGLIPSALTACLWHHHEPSSRPPQSQSSWPIRPKFIVLQIVS